MTGWLNRNEIYFKVVLGTALTLAGLFVAWKANDISEHSNDIAEEQANIAQEQATIALDQATIVAHQATMAADQGTAAADQSTIVGHQATMAAGQATAGAEQATIVGHQATIAAGQATVAVDQAAIVGHQATIAAGQATVAVDQKNIVARELEFIEAQNKTAISFDILVTTNQDSERVDLVVVNTGGPVRNLEIVRDAVIVTRLWQDFGPGGEWVPYRPGTSQSEGSFVSDKRLVSSFFDEEDRTGESNGILMVWRGDSRGLGNVAQLKSDLRADGWGDETRYTLTVYVQVSFRDQFSEHWTQVYEIRYPGETVEYLGEIFPEFDPELRRCRFTAPGSAPFDEPVDEDDIVICSE